MRTECLWIKPVKDVQVIVSVPSKAGSGRRSIQKMKPVVEGMFVARKNGIKNECAEYQGRSTHDDHK